MNIPVTLSAPIMATYLSLIFTLCSLALLVTFILIDVLCKHSLWSSSADFAHNIQSESWVANYFFEFIASFSLVITALVQSTVYFGLSYSLGIGLVFVTSIGSAVPSMLKMIYSDPRPYWEFDEVRAISCETGWGNPSGHAMFTGSVWVCVALLCVYSRKVVACIAVLLWIALVGFDRVYLGVHFYSQVILGWCFGVVVAGGFLEVIERTFEQRKISLRLWEVLGCHFASILLLVLPILLYYVRHPHWDEAWTTRISNKCSIHYTLSKAESEALIETAVFSFFPGAVLGAYLSFRSSSLLEPPQIKAWKRFTLGLVSCIPLLCEGGSRNVQLVSLAKKYLVDSPWAGYSLTLIVSYASGIAYTFAVPLLFPSIKTHPYNALSASNPNRYD